MRFGELRRITPIDANWGNGRGRPLDRYYVERFLEAHAGHVRGRVLEVSENTYTLRFGGANVVTSDVLHVVPGAQDATIIADLMDAPHVPSDTFDCIVLTQTLQFIYDVPAALRTLHRILRPGGWLLATVPGITKLDRGQGGDQCWTFTDASVQRLCATQFGASNVSVDVHGNVLAAVAFLHGLADRELTRAELDARDADYQVIITVAARKAGPVA